MSTEVVSNSILEENVSDNVIIPEDRSNSVNESDNSASSKMNDDNTENSDQTDSESEESSSVEHDSESFDNIRIADVKTNLNDDDEDDCEDEIRTMYKQYNKAYYVFRSNDNKKLYISRNNDDNNHRILINGFEFALNDFINIVNDLDNTQKIHTSYDTSTDVSMIAVLLFSIFCSGISIWLCLLNTSLNVMNNRCYSM